MYWAVNLAKEYLLELNTNEDYKITDDDILKAIMQHKEKKEESANL
jgi:hypothetical protein